MLENREGNGLIGVIVDGGGTQLVNLLGARGDSIHIVGQAALVETDFIFL